MPEMMDCGVCSNVFPTEFMYMPLWKDPAVDRICEACVTHVHSARHKRQKREIRQRAQEFADGRYDQEQFDVS